jgi:hypothetical protein
MYHRATIARIAAAAMVCGVTFRTHSMDASIQGLRTDIRLDPLQSLA